MSQERDVTSVVVVGGGRTKVETAVVVACLAKVLLPVVTMVGGG